VARASHTRGRVNQITSSMDVVEATTGKCTVVLSVSNSPIFEVC
jgi:hypothetical protein